MFQVTEDGYVVVYVDGSFKPASSGEPHALAGVGAFFGVDHFLNISKDINAAGLKSNDVEVRAITEALKVVRARGYTRVEVRSDAKTVVELANQGAPGHRREPVYQQLMDVEKGMNVRYVHFSSDSDGVKQADKLAGDAIRRK